MSDPIEIHACWLGDGTKTMACPHCGRSLEVDIDEFLPVHSRTAHIHIHVDVDTCRIDTPNPIDDLCDGSWDTKGVAIKFLIWADKDNPPWKKKNDAP